MTTTRLAGARLVRDPGQEAGHYAVQLPSAAAALSGHYPGYPIVPGVFLMEIAAAAEGDYLGGTALGGRWTGVRSLRFRAPVFPGQRILVSRSESRGGPRYTMTHEDGMDVAVIDLEVDQDAPPRPTAEADCPDAVGVAPAQVLPTPAQVLPHRPPMLLLDRVLGVEPGVSLTASYEVTADAGGATPSATEPLPWPLVLESWAQSAAMLATWAEPSPDVHTGSVLLFGGARQVSFGAAPLPATTLVHRVTLLADVGGAAVLSGSSQVGTRQVLHVGQLTIGRRPASALPHPHPARHQEVAR